MEKINYESQWKEYCQKEIDLLMPILKAGGYFLEEAQPHLQGERFLQQAVTTTGGKKLILLGKQSENKVVIKATRDNSGKQELLHERRCRQVLKKINFASNVLNTPKEIAFIEKDDFIISIQEYVDQPKAFLDRPLEEQFAFSLSAFKAQEGTHATTPSHFRLVKDIYEQRNSDSYLKYFKHFCDHPYIIQNPETHNRLQNALKILKDNKISIERYCGFLTHTDFVPHNFRIDKDGVIYLLDHSSLAFGNKHEGWARFINFMTLYNPLLEENLINYVKANRSAEELTSLWLMRLYRLGEITCYYANTLNKSHGQLYQLNSTRVEFWSQIMSFVINNEKVPLAIISDYQKRRDDLRSEAEKIRQKGLH